MILTGGDFVIFKEKIFLKLDELLLRN